MPGQLVCIRTDRLAVGVGVELKGDRPTGGVWCEVHVTNTPRTADWCVKCRVHVTHTPRTADWDLGSVYYMYQTQRTADHTCTCLPRY